MSHLMIRGNILSPNCNIVMEEHTIVSKNKNKKQTNEKNKTKKNSILTYAKTIFF